MKTLDFTKLTRNPLGVIGLFIWLIYSIAGMVFAISISQLSYSIQLILTLFIVLFPPAILFVFYFLVTRHHNKLYAPGDFKDERLFFRPGTLEEVQEKLKSIVIEQETSEAAASSSIESAVGLHNFKIDTQPLNYVAIEAAALDWAENDYGRKIPRDIVTEIDGSKFIFDGVYQDESRLDLFEVKVYRRPAFKREFIEAVMYRATSLILHDSVSKKDREFCLWLIIVTDFEGEALIEFEQRMKRAVDTNNFEVKWLFVPKSKLKLKSG